ncbi:MAG: hypothetical protein K0U84_18280 [Actinomycetia bacterium]|nr:hypothetical protein [Actinomycetes bacterium]
MARFVVCGTGRSATTWAAAVFRICGLPVTHQKVFTWDSVAKRDWMWGDSVGEASYMSVPLLAGIAEREPDTVIILLRRDREAVAASWVGRDGFRNPKARPEFHACVRDMFPTVFDVDDPYKQALRYVDAWNGYAERFADHVFDVEGLPPRTLFEVTGHADDYRHVLATGVSTTINSDKH